MTTEKLQFNYKAQK